MPPDCWTESRNYHSQGIPKYLDKVRITKVQEPKPKVTEFSPNKGYFYHLSERTRPNAILTVYTEKEYLVRIEFTDVFGLSDVKWINENLLFMRAWWGRIRASDLIFSVEKERIIHHEILTDGHIAYHQYREGCKRLGGCRCIQKQ